MSRLFFFRLPLGYLSAFDFGLIIFLALANEISQNPYLVVIVLIKVEAIAMAEPDLKEVVV